MKTSSLILIVKVVATLGLMAQGRGNSANQSVTLEVKPIVKISGAGNLTPLIINDALPGSDLASVSDENTKYNLITNVDNMKIVTSINDRMPAGTKLMIKLTNRKAASVGLVDLSSALTPVDVVRGIRKGSDTNQSINYTFAANAEVEGYPVTIKNDYINAYELIQGHEKYFFHRFADCFMSSYLLAGKFVNEKLDNADGNVCGQPFSEKRFDCFNKPFKCQHIFKLFRNDDTSKFIKKMFVKVTIAETSTNAAVSKNASVVQMDVRSVLQERNSATIDKIPTIVTVTE